MIEVENGGRENHPHRVERAAFARRSRWVPRSTKRPGPLSDLWAPPSIRTNVLLYFGQTDLTFGERIPRENWGGGSIEASRSRCLPSFKYPMTDPTAAPTIAPATIALKEVWATGTRSLSIPPRLAPRKITVLDRKSTRLN